MLLWNPESGIQLKESEIPQSDWNQESKYHWQGLESSFKTVLGSLTWDVLLINLMHPGSNNDVLKRWKWYNFERMMRQCISSLYDTVVEYTSRWIDHESVCVPFQTNCFNNCQYVKRFLTYVFSYIRRIQN